MPKVQGHKVQVIYLFIKFVCVLQLNNRLFEELAMDVYDEVDRRENDAGEPRSASLLADVDANENKINNIQKKNGEIKHVGKNAD